MDELLGTLIATQPIDGRYFSTLDPPFDEHLAKAIEDEAVKEHIIQVNSKNAGKLLFIIWKKAGIYATFVSSYPSCGLEEAQCNDYANGDPGLIPVLAEVHRIKAYAWFCDNFPSAIPRTRTKTSPLLNDGYIEVLLSADVEPKLKALLHTYLENNTQLPLWKSQSASDEIRSHISSLKIPKISEASQSPSLLLHGLGRPSHDTKLADRVKNLFRADSGWTAMGVCNTPGSGKTRLILEGLCYYWGLYFTAQTGPECIGSKDLEKILEQLEQQKRLVTSTENNHSSALNANREATSRRFLLVLYVRLLVLRVFLDCASAMPSGITEEHKNRWLLLQAAPGLLSGAPDIFHALDLRFRPALLSDLESSVKTELQKIQHHIGQSLFCVLDEAQIPTNMSLNWFRSDVDQEAPRPLLRQIVFTWKIWLPDIIVSGTGVSMQDLETVFRSAVAKEGGASSETFTDLGAFDDEDAQHTYLEQYLPPGSLQMESWKEVAARVGYWLHGRHRFTATYLSRLIQNNFEQPHRVLNDFVFSMTGFYPSDRDDSDGIAATLGPLHKFDFANLGQDGPLLRRIAGFIVDYIFHGKPRGVGGSIYEKLVEYGVARFGDHRNIIADEPLALLAAVQYFNTKTGWDLQHFLLEGLSDSNESARGTAFEHYGAYLLGLAFKSPRPLSNVFSFVGDNSEGLEDETGQLVGVERTEGGVVCHPVDISSMTGPTYLQGCTLRTEENTLSWLQNPRRTIFCFPAHTIGPDLILVLRLSDETVVRVIVQFKYKIEQKLSSGDTQAAFSSTDPNQFVSQRSTSSLSRPGKVQGTNLISQQTDPLVRNPNLCKQLQNALLELGPGTKKAGKFGVLRVLIAFPTPPDEAALTKAANGDKGRHPAATVDVQSLTTDTLEQQTLISLKDKVEAAAIQAAQQRKRKRQLEAEARSAKRIC